MRTPEDFGMGQLFWEIRDAVVVGDAETGCIVLWNPAAAELFGIPAAEALGLPIEVLVPEPLRSRHRAGLARFRETGGGSIIDTGQPVELPAVRRTGEPITIELTLSPIAASRVPGRFVLAVIRDATARKQTEMDRLRLAREQASRAAEEAEAGLQEAEAKYRALVEQLPAIVSLNAHDAASSTLYISPQVEEILGYSSDAYTADPAFWLQTVHPDDRERVLAEIARTNLTGEPFRMEYRKVTRDGKVIWILDEGVLVRDAVCRPRHWQTVQLDITDRKRAEEALEREHDLLHALLESLPDAVYVKDTAGRFVRLNAATARQLGATDPAEAIGKTDFDFFPEPLAREYFEDEQRLLVTGHPMVSKAERQTNATHGRWVLTTKVPQRDARGEIVGLVGINRDITDLHHTQEALRRSEARFRSLITNATDLITILAADGTVLYESPPIERILGYDRDELVGRNAFDLVHPEDRAATWAAFADALADPTLVPTVEFRFLHQDGSWRWLESTGTNLLADDDVAGFVVNSRDITERKRIDEDLRAALEAAHEANRAKSVFLDMMSHELRTPLQATLGYSEFLLHGPTGSLTAEQREDIGYIHQAGVRMINLINQLLDLSRMEAGRLTFATEPVDLAKVIEQVRQDVAPQAAAKSLALQIDLPPSLPAVLGDAERLRQILLNLVGNAVKFTEAGWVRIAGRITDDGVAVAVTDTGLGVPPETLPHIFEEFRQADHGMTRRYEGAGLGLAIAKKLTEHMGGRINVESCPGVGSTFTLHLPGSRPLS